MARKALSKKTRFEVFKRDEFTCQYCGQKPPAVILEIDHVIAVANGGDNSEPNLVSCCVDCNRGKSCRPLTQKSESLERQMKVEKERAEQVEAYNDFLLAQRNKLEDKFDRLGVYWFNKFRKEKDQTVFGAARIPSIRTFIKNLTEVEIMDAMDIAFERMRTFGDDDRKVWKYFCGVCWNIIKRRNQ